MQTHIFGLTLATLLVVAQNALPSEIDSNCRANNHQLLNENLVNPVGIKSFIDQNGIKSVEDLVCCLPKEYRDNFVVIHSSESAQSSDLANPRVLMFNKTHFAEGNPKRLNAVLSFNGGDPQLSNANNVELMYANPTSGEAEFYDFNFESKKPHPIERNSKSCLQCHGENGSLPVGGAKTIFENSDNWTRSVQGLHACRNEVPLSRAIEKREQSVFKSNPRYRCLNQKVATEDHFSGQRTSTSPELTELDTSLNILNAKRVGKQIRLTSDYEKYKYAIVGSIACFNFNENSDFASFERGNFSGWFPQRVEDGMNSVNTLNPEIRGATNPEDIVKSILLKATAEVDVTNGSQKTAIADLNAGKKVDPIFYRGPMDVCKSNQANAKAIAADLKSTMTGPRTLDLYKADAIVQGFRGSKFNPFLRYVFESRGIPVDGFGLTPVSGRYPASPAFLLSALLDAERNDRLLTEMYNDLKSHGTIFPLDLRKEDFKNIQSTTEEETKTRLQQWCGRLKKASAEAFLSDANSPSQKSSRSPLVK